jgi:hypothetical protein
MNNIEILENFIDKQKSNKDTFVPTDFEITALENLIQENKELKEKNKKQSVVIIEYQDLLEDSIPKLKVKEKIEEKIKEGNYRTIDNPSGRIHFQKEITDYQIQVLQELLKEEE